MHGSSDAAAPPGLLIEGAASIATLAGGLRRGAAQADAAELSGDSLAVAMWGDRLIAAGPRAEVQRQIEGLMLEMFGVSKCHGVERNEKPHRGFRGVKFRDEAYDV